MMPIVAEYFEKQSLSKIGYTFNGDDEDTFKVHAFTVIHGVINEEKEKKEKAQNRKKVGRRR